EKRLFEERLQLGVPPRPEQRESSPVEVLGVSRARGEDPAQTSQKISIFSQSLRILDGLLDLAAPGSGQGPCIPPDVLPVWRCVARQAARARFHLCPVRRVFARKGQHPVEEP